MSTGKRITLLSCAFALLVALAFWMASYAQHQRHNRLIEVAGAVQLSVERYAFDHNGCYPQSLAQLRQAGYLLDIPANPLAGGSVPLLRPGDPALPGGVVYVPIGPVIAQPQPAARGNQPVVLTIPAAHSVNHEVDSYCLAVYDDRTANSDLRQQELRSALESASAGPEAQQAGLGVDWEKVAVVLSAGTQCFQ